MNPLDILKNIFYLPTRAAENSWYYLYNRFVSKSHTLETGLDVGQYHELDERILHGLMTELVKFIEYEKGSLEIISLQGLGEPWREYSLPELGLKFLDWEISEPDVHPEQAAVAKVQQDLYIWWKWVRPERGDPYEVLAIEDFNISDLTKLTKEVRETLDNAAEVKLKYFKEDQYMLHKLIEIRDSLWT